MDQSDNEEEQEEEEEVHDGSENETLPKSPEKNKDRSGKETGHEEMKLQEELAKELKHSLKITMTGAPPDIGPTPYKVAIVGMNELGSATAFLLICRQVVTDVILIDRNAKRLAGIVMSLPFERSLKYVLMIHWGEYADLSTCTTFVSGVNVQASNQLASCEGARIVILCDVSNDDEPITKQQKNVQDSSSDERILADVKTICRAISLYGEWISTRG